MSHRHRGRRDAPAAADARARGRARAGRASRSRCGCSPSAATSTFVSSSSPQYKATQRFYRSFGEEPVEVLVKGNLQQLLLSSDIDRLVGLEGCLSGNVPASALGARGRVATDPAGSSREPEDREGRARPGHVRQRGRRTDRRTARRAQTKQAEAQAARSRQLARQQGRARARALGARKPQTLGKQASSITIGALSGGARDAGAEVRADLQAEPRRSRASCRRWCSTPTKPAGTPKQRFAYLFPSPNAALISVRMQRRAVSSSAAHANDRVDPPGGGDAAVAACSTARATW